MSRTNNPSVSVYNYAITTYVNSGGSSPNFTINLSVSAETSTNLIGYLSGNSSVAAPYLSGTLYTTSLSTLSSPSNGIILVWPTILANTTVFGYVASSSVFPATSSFTAVIEFNDLNFYTNTLFNLSGNKAAVVIDYPGVSTPSSLDNPFNDYGNNITTSSSIATTFWTVGEFLRRKALNG